MSCFVHVDDVESVCDIWKRKLLYNFFNAGGGPGGMVLSSSAENMTCLPANFYATNNFDAEGYICR